MKSLKTLKCSLLLKTTQNFGAYISQNRNFYKYLSPLVHFDYSSLKACFAGIIYQIIQKDFFFLLFAIFILHSQESNVLLCFGR